MDAELQLAAHLPRNKKYEAGEFGFGQFYHVCLYYPSELSSLKCFYDGRRGRKVDIMALIVHAVRVCVSLPLFSLEFQAELNETPSIWLLLLRVCHCTCFRFGICFPMGCSVFYLFTARWSCFSSVCVLVELQYFPGGSDD